MAAAVVTLGVLGVPVEHVATLCGTDTRRVRQLRKGAKATTPSAANRSTTRSKSADGQETPQQTEQGAA